MKTNIEKLKEENETLESLLNDPHPGLFTWQQAVRETVKNMYEVIYGN